MHFKASLVIEQSWPWSSTKIGAYSALKMHHSLLYFCRLFEQPACCGVCHKALFGNWIWPQNWICCHNISASSLLNDNVKLMHSKWWKYKIIFASGAFLSEQTTNLLRKIPTSDTLLCRIFDCTSSYEEFAKGMGSSLKPTVGNGASESGAMRVIEFLESWPAPESKVKSTCRRIKSEANLH